MEQSNLQVLLAQGSIHARTLVWREGLPEWLAIESVPELKGAEF